MVEKFPHNKFAKRLSLLMKEESLSVRELSEIADVSYEMARRWTMGTAKPRTQKIEIIAEKYNYNKAWLEHGEGAKKRYLIKETDRIILSSEVGEINAEYLSAETKELIEIIKTADKKRSIGVRLFKPFLQMLYVSDPSLKNV